MPNNLEMYLKQEDIMAYITWKLSNNSIIGSYWYDLYLPTIMSQWLEENKKLVEVDTYWRANQHLPVISPSFYEASWELCRRGIIRPGIKKHWAQSTDDGSAGNWYSVTPFWKIWLSEKDKDNFIPTEPWRFGEMISPYSKIFWAWFHVRAQEAIRCYGSHAYLACCVMCGAAVESVLLNLAISKKGDEQAILKDYCTTSGRSKLEKLLISSQKDNIKNEFTTCFWLLKYWRDEAAHGTSSTISENEAYTSLALLLRCAQFSTDNYNLLTGKSI